MKSNGFTHGGSVSKNLRLLLRALLNILGFGLLWFGLWAVTEGDRLITPLSTALVAAGVILCAVGVTSNLFGPWFSKKNRD